MAKLTRVTAKIFGETADGTLADPEIGQFGSAKAGTYVGTGDIATIQNLSAWSNGWIDAVTPTQQFPTLPERTGVDKVLSYQNAYVLQQGIPEWDSATDYYTNGFCSKNGKIYFSKTDNNVNHDPETDTVNWEEFTSGGASRNIGEIVSSTIPLTDAGLHLLDGGWIELNGSYREFVEYILSLYPSYPNLFADETGYNYYINTYGVCGKFYYDEVNQRLRLPKITGFIEGASGVANLGDLTQAGLPNITGTFTHMVGSASTSGVFTQTVTGTGILQNGAGGSYVRTTFDASDSNSIYGNSPTVQPQSIKVLYYIVIATSTKTDIQVDIDEIATDLNNKADRDLTNVNNAGTSRGASWAMPSSTYTALTLGASGSTYTAPANGWFYINSTSTNNTNYIGISIDTINNVISVENGDPESIMIPAKNGDVATVTYTNINTSNSIFKFIYAQGSESEA